MTFNVEERIEEILDNTISKRKIKQIFLSDERIKSMNIYQGFVPNSYRWPILRSGVCVNRSGKLNLTFNILKYDAKRSHGKGPTWVAFSEKGGRLRSG